MANLTTTDEDELLEIDEAKANDATRSKDELMMTILPQMSANLNTVSERSSTCASRIRQLRTPQSRPKKLNRRLKQQCLNQTIVIVRNKADSGATNGQRDESPDGLLDEIAQSLEETERTDEAVAEKLADIANKRWLQRLSDEKLKESWKNGLDQSIAIKLSYLK